MGEKTYLLLPIQKLFNLNFILFFDKAFMNIGLILAENVSKLHQKAAENDTKQDFLQIPSRFLGMCAGVKGQ